MASTAFLSVCFRILSTQRRQFLPVDKKERPVINLEAVGHRTDYYRIIMHRH